MRFITKKHLSRRTFLRGVGVHDVAAVPRVHGAGADTAGENSRESADPAGNVLHPARRGDGQLDARRRWARSSSRRPGAARTLQGSGGGAQQSGAQHGRSSGTGR